jgi:hypothetical protein
VQALFGVMVDGGAQLLEIAPCAAAFALIDGVAMLDIGAAGAARDIFEGSLAPEIEQPLDTLEGFDGAAMGRDAIGCVEAQDIGKRCQAALTLLACRGVLLGEIFTKDFFSSSTFIRADSSARDGISVADDPHGGASSVFWLEPESWAFGATRHAALIREMAASVTKCLPAISSASSRPRAISRRKDEALIAPQGNAIPAATSSRSGVSSDISKAARGMGFLTLY